MKKLIVLSLMFVTAITAGDSPQLKKLRSEFNNHGEGLRKKPNGFDRDCKLWMLGQAINNIEWRNEGHAEEYSEKEIALEGIDIIVRWFDKDYVSKWGQTWDMCEEQNRDLHRFVEDLYDNEEVNKEVIVIDQLKIYEAFNALTIDKSVKSNEEVNKE